MKKRLLSLLMASTMVFTLTACGNKEEEKKPEAGDSTPAPTEQAQKEEEEKLTAELLVWSPAEDQADDQGKWLQTMCEKFNEAHPNWDITFKYGVAPESDVDALLMQDAAASADVFMYANDKLGKLVPANVIAEFGGETLEDIKSTNSQAIVDSVTVDGSVYGVPFTTNTWFMYYDKSAFSEEDIKSLDKMLEKGKVSFPLTNTWYFASFYVANGCTLFGDGTDEAAGIDFGGEKATAVTNYLVDLMKNKNFVVDADGSGIAGLADGSIKAMFSGSWDYANVKEALGDNFGAAQLPSITINGEEKQLKSFAGSKAIGVNANSKNMKVAVALAKFLGSAEAQKAHYELRNIVPCNTELLAEEAVQSDALVVAQNNTFDSTSIIQPFVSKMDNYWTPAESFSKEIQIGKITKENSAEKTEEFNKAVNTSVIK